MSQFCHFLRNETFLIKKSLKTVSFHGFFADLRESVILVALMRSWADRDFPDSAYEIVTEQDFIVSAYQLFGKTRKSCVCAFAHFIGHWRV